ncbi:MAG: methyltransferase domain-containing protein [Candidatus Thiodiazotropha sp.]
MQGYQVKFETLTIGEVDYTIRSLLDRQQYFDPDGAAESVNIPPAMWPIFGLVWPAGLYLAERMSRFPIKGKRILEVGCGLALASLVLHQRGGDVTSTDLHPLAEAFLEENITLNNMLPLPFHFGSWEGTELPLEKFDLIIGSDVLYEPEHPDLLAGFIDRHANEQVEVIIVDPGRGNHGRFNRAMDDLGFSNESAALEQQAIRQSLKKGRVLNYQRDLQ